jgi:hypothetical protein
MRCFILRVSEADKVIKALLVGIDDPVAGMLWRA